MVQAIALVGEFNDWDPKDHHWAMKDEFGNFNLFLPDVDGKPQVPHRCDTPRPLPPHAPRERVLPLVACYAAALAVVNLSTDLATVPSRTSSGSLLRLP